MVTIENRKVHVQITALKLDPENDTFSVMLTIDGTPRQFTGTLVAFQAEDEELLALNVEGALWEAFNEHPLVPSKVVELAGALYQGEQITLPFEVEEDAA